MRKFPCNFAVGMMMAAGIFFLAGCATYPPPKETIPNSRNYGSSYGDVWDSVLAALSDMEIQVQSMDKETGIIVAEDGTVELRQFELGRYDSTYCFCGKPVQFHFFRGLVGEHTISVIRRNKVQTTVKIDASFTVLVQSGKLVTGSHNCLTKGVFEPLFLDQVEIQLASRKAPEKREWWKPRRGY